MSDDTTLDTSGKVWSVEQTEHDGTVVHVSLGEAVTEKLKAALASDFPEPPAVVHHAPIANPLGSKVRNVADARQLLAHPIPVARAAMISLRRHQSTEVAAFAHHALKAL